MTSPQNGSIASAPAAPALILASASEARAGMLRQAGLDPVVQPPGVDEAGLKRAMRAEQAPARDVALALAELKATRVSQGRPQDLVIGADQVLVCAGRQLDKPADLAAAADTLRQLRGRAHQLVTAAAVARGGTVIWRHVASAQLQARDYSDAFIADYLSRLGPAALAAAGAYQLEGRGAQLFHRVDGDFFVILGLPLLPLLDFLRGHGIVQR